MATKKKPENNKCWPRYAEIVNLGHYWWECKIVQPIWKTYSDSSKKIKNKITV